MKKSLLKIVLAVLFFTSVTSLGAGSKKVTVDVLYFHATIRCQGCLTIEEYIKNTVDLHFTKEQKNGTLTFFSLDFLKPENQHFQDDYKFDGQTLIIRKIVDGKIVKWKNLDKIWDYSNNYEKFSNYVKKEIIRLLNES